MKKETKGIWHQIRDVNVSNYSDKISMGEVVKIVDQQINYFRGQQRKTKEGEEDIEHLKKRSKELGKGVPIVLELMAKGLISKYVGLEFMEQYKEWL